MIKSRPMSIAASTFGDTSRIRSSISTGLVKWLNVSWEPMGTFSHQLEKGCLGMRPTQKKVKMEKGKCS